MKQVAKSEIERGLSFIVPYTLHINIKWLGYTGWKPEIYFFIFRQIKAYNCTTEKVGKKSEIKYDLPFLVLVVKSHYHLLTWSLSYWVKPKIVEIKSASYGHGWSLMDLTPTTASGNGGGGIKIQIIISSAFDPLFYKSWHTSNGWKTNI
jgi:hypothetical protein